MKTQIDLNCDLGEWRSDNGPMLDRAIMPFITSCNIACGGHIGSEFSMRKTVLLAKKHKVKIGAHPSFPDRSGFGRRVMEIDPTRLKNSLKDQILALKTIAEDEGEQLHHIKPHGALYNEASKEKEVADLVIESVKELGLKVMIFGQPDSELERSALDSGLAFCAEVFADRVYESDLSLRSREFEGSVLTDRSEVLAQVFEMVIEEEVSTYGGERKKINAQTICLHSDTKGADILAKEINQFLRKHGVNVLAF